MIYFHFNFTYSLKLYAKLYIFRLKTSLTSSAMTGKNMIMVAVLLANSVKQARKAVINITAAAGGT